MSVPAEDELLQQSLEQSLCPNEEDSTDSTPTPSSTPVWGLGSTFLRICSPTDGTNDFAPCQGQMVDRTCAPPIYVPVGMEKERETEERSEREEMLSL